MSCLTKSFGYLLVRIERYDRSHLDINRLSYFPRIIVTMHLSSLMSDGRLNRAPTHRYLAFGNNLCRQLDYRGPLVLKEPKDITDCLQGWQGIVWYSYACTIAQSKTYELQRFYYTDMRKIRPGNGMDGGWTHWYQEMNLKS